MIAAPHFQAFLDGLPTAARAAIVERPDVDAQLRSILARVLDVTRERWSPSEVMLAGFATFVATHVGDDLVGGLSRLEKHAADLYLAYACARGEAGALATFDREYAEDIALAGKRSAGVLDVDDFRQRVAEKLLVAAPGERPAIASYAGRSTLRTWIRTCAVNLAIDQTRQRGRNGEKAELEAEALANLASSSENLDLDLVRRRYADAFAQSISAALDDLDPRARNIIRYHTFAGLNIDQIAAIYGTHRTTAFRWIERARAALLEAARIRLATQLGSEIDDVASIMRALAPTLDVSIRRMLGSSVEPES